jgi:Nif-specific regulatory protein
MWLETTMNPRLIVIAGALKGAVFALPDGECFIGRDLSNSICLSDESVSRRHCLIDREQDDYRIIDLDSFNGTWVNGVPVKKQLLEHGDQIALGGTVFLFLLHEAKTDETVSVVQLQDEEFTARTTARLRREEALYLHPQKVLASLPPTDRVARNLTALIKISAAINSIRDLKKLQQNLLELIFEVTPSERGAILLTGANTDEFVSIFGRDNSGSQQKEIRVSRTITEQVLRDGISVLCNDIVRSEALDKADSLIASKTRSLLCVPLIYFESALGLIYLDTKSEIHKFDESDLQLMTAVASIAAVAFENALHMEMLEGESRQLATEINIKHRMVGDSPRMREVYQLIAQVAPTDITALIRGESGTGKELVAHAIHLNSPRMERPFVAINCAAITETLFESEFFGYEKGAFSGAAGQKKGLLEIVDDGTVFLDEIGELSVGTQAKLLRALEEREFRRVGGTTTIKIKARVIAATNKKLEEAIKQGTFREDLYYRINVLAFEIPPLRERRGDILLLASYFVEEYNKKHDRRVVGFCPEARSRLLNHSWPGNVRELRNVIERAVVLSRDEMMKPELFPEPVAGMEISTTRYEVKYEDTLKESKKQLVLRAIQQAGGNYTKAAKILGMHPNNLHRLLRTLNLKVTR